MYLISTLMHTICYAASTYNICRGRIHSSTKNTTINPVPKNKTKQNKTKKKKKHNNCSASMIIIDAELLMISE